MELGLHLPVALWAVWGRSGLRRGEERHGGVDGGGGSMDRKATETNRLGVRAELVLLCYGLQTAVTTATCIYEVLGWQDETVTTARQKAVLVGGLYGPYFILRELVSWTSFRSLTPELLLKTENLESCGFVIFGSLDNVFRHVWASC